MREVGKGKQVTEMAEGGVDTLIVGQGLAGSLLAWHLIRAGQRVLVVDDGHASASSTVAAGLFNPVTGKRLVKQAGAEELIAAAQSCYADLAEQFGQCFFHHKPLLKLFANAAEREQWQRRRSDPAYAGYLGEAFEPGASGEAAALHDPHGSGRQLQTGYLATEPLLGALRDWLVGQGAYCESAFAPGQLQLEDGAVRWGGVGAQRVLFCEGFRLRANPFFGWLPLQPAQGTILTMKSNGPLPASIINGGRWLLPLGDGVFKLGATYRWDPFSLEPDSESCEELLASLPGLLAEPPRCEVVANRVGVRPGTRDKHPFIGWHPVHPQLGVFNGFGSKGSLLIPWYARHFSEHLTAGIPLRPEADIRRFAALAQGAGQ